MRYKALTRRDLPMLATRYGISAENVHAADIVSAVLPFRVNEYILELIDWSNVDADPIYKLVFPQRGMLSAADFASMERALKHGRSDATAFEIRNTLNPQPDNQEGNIPQINGKALIGLQHKYRESLLVFPSISQTCHAYCTFCFRYPQFVDTNAVRFSLSDPEIFKAYLKDHPEITDVLFTGGDPLIASTATLERFIMPAIDAGSVTSIRIGTKSLGYWPHRFTDEADADDLLRLFERIRNAGKSVTLMAHFTHVRELQTSVARRALQRLETAGAVVRTQTPILRDINDSPEALSSLWKAQVQYGCIPYYMFMPRDTGAHTYFDVPLARAITIVADAKRNLSGLTGSARGPVMSTKCGKVEALGSIELAGVKSFVLRFLRAVDATASGTLFLADFNEEASCFRDLRLHSANAPHLTT